jgi:hypothetical protein
MRLIYRMVFTIILVLAAVGLVDPSQGADLKTVTFYVA